MTTKSTTKPISLKVIGSLLLSNNSVASTLSENPRVFTAKELKNKFPVLKPLGDTPLIQLYKTDSGNSCRIPCLYTKDEQVVIAMPDLNATITNDFTVEQWQAGDVNKAVITCKKTGISLSAAIAFKNYFLEHIRVDRDNHCQSDSVEKLNIQWLEDAPAIEIPLRKLPLNEILTIISISDVRSKKYNTQLVNIKTSNGNIYKNVLTNSSLRELIADDIKQFKITDVVPMPTKNRNSSKRETRTIQKVFLEPVMSADFSEL